MEGKTGILDDPNAKWDIDQWLKVAARSSISNLGFYVTNISTPLNLRPAEVMVRLLHHVRDGKLKLLFEAESPCPKCGSNCLVLREDGEEISAGFYCKNCGSEFCANPDSLFPVFYFTFKYKEFAHL